MRAREKLTCWGRHMAENGGHRATALQGLKPKDGMVT